MGHLQAAVFKYVMIVSIVFTFYLFISDRKGQDRWASPLLFFCLLVSLGIPLVFGINAEAGISHVLANTAPATAAITILLFPILFLYVPVLVAMRIAELSDRIKFYVSAPFFVVQAIYFHVAVNYGTFD